MVLVTLESVSKESQQIDRGEQHRTSLATINNINEYKQKTFFVGLRVNFEI